MNIIIAPDSFKGSLSAFEICTIAENVAKDYFPDFIIQKVPMADGGEGTVESLIHATNGTLQKVLVHDPLGNITNAKYGILGDGETAVIEMAEASGLHKIAPEQRNPMITSTYGTGEMIKEALNQGCRKFIIGIGGSATNDCGTGLIQALGAKIYNKNNQLIQPGGAGLLEADFIDLTNFDPRVKEATFTIACDVNNPLTGPNGAAYVFAPQKGATIDMVKKLDEGLKNYATVIFKTLKIKVETIPGAGAAGGLGACFYAFFNGQMQSGIDIVIQNSCLEDYIKEATLVITGEGKIDGQTGFGKTPHGVAKVAKKYDKPVVAICGILDADLEDLKKINIDCAFSILNRTCGIEDAICDAKNNLKSAFYNIFTLIHVTRQ